MKRGLLITLEGGEGSGKTKQMEYITQWFIDHNLPFITTREPGGTNLGEDIREILKHAKYEITPKSEMLLFNASRAEIVEEVIKPALNNGKNVICDRYYDSSIAYQGYGRGLDISDVTEICQYATDNLVPDLTIWLDIPPELAFGRKHGPDKDDRLENSAMEFHKRVYNGYKELYKSNPRFVRVDATKSIEDNNHDIDKILSEKLL